MKKLHLKELLIGKFTGKRLLRSSLLIYLTLCVYAFFFTDRQIFQPPLSSYQDSQEILKLTSVSGNKISALYLPHPQGTYTILYSHGNAEDLGMIRPRLQSLFQAGFNVFAYDYQGYGTSQGKPSETGSYEDIKTAYNFLVNQSKIPPDRMILYGRSIGSGPTVDLASKQPVAGVILESPFMTIFRVITVIPLFPFDKFDNLAKIKKVDVPLLILHGTADKIIPFWHGETLFSQANFPKKLHGIKNAGHDDVVELAGQEYFQHLQEFMKGLRWEDH